MKILLFADIHIGSIKDTIYVYNTITDIIEKEVVLTKCDMVVILGDYFHRLFKVNEEYVSLAINVMSYLIRSCSRCNTKIRIVYGTESHEMNQYRLFNYHFTSSEVDIRVIETVADENIDGKNILYLPEEYITDKHDHYKDYLYSGKRYDYIFGHGVIVEGMPAVVSYSSTKTNEKQVPHFKSGELSEAGKLIVFGHYHCHVDLDGNVHYLGSLFRDSFGEEDPKGYGVINDDEFTFIENKDAYVYKTYEFNESSNIYGNADNIIKEIERIKSNHPDIFNGEKFGKIRLIFHVPDNIDPTFRENLHSIIFNDKHFQSMIKETSMELLSEIRDELNDEYDFILDNSLSVLDKIHRYINKQYDVEMPLDTLSKYLKDMV